MSSPPPSKRRHPKPYPYSVQAEGTEPRLAISPAAAAAAGERKSPRPGLRPTEGTLPPPFRLSQEQNQGPNSSCICIRGSYVVKLVNKQTTTSVAAVDFPCRRNRRPSHRCNRRAANRSAATSPLRMNERQKGAATSPSSTHAREMQATQRSGTGPGREPAHARAAVGTHQLANTRGIAPCMQVRPGREGWTRGQRATSLDCARARGAVLV